MYVKLLAHHSLRAYYELGTILGMLYSLTDLILKLTFEEGTIISYISEAILSSR